MPTRCYARLPFAGGAWYGHVLSGTARFFYDLCGCGVVREKRSDMKQKAVILDEEKLKKTIARLSHEIIESNPDLREVVLVGIKTRGIPFAGRLAAAIELFTGERVNVDELDISLYRDDLTEISAFPEVKNVPLKQNVAGKTVVICDDVIFTGRTARAAIDAIVSCGRPARIRLAVVVDRGHREFPIKPDHIGKNVPTSREEVVSVRFTETDGEDSVSIWEN